MPDGQVVLVLDVPTVRRAWREHLAGASDRSYPLWGVLMFGVLAPGLGALTIPVAIYSLAICVMMWRAAARLPTRGAGSSDRDVGARKRKYPRGPIGFPPSDQRDV